MGVLQFVRDRFARAVYGTSSNANAGWYSESIRDRYLVTVGTQFTKQSIQGYFSNALSGDTRFLSIFKQEMRAADAHLDGECRKIESMLTQSQLELLPYPAAARKSVRGLQPSGDLKKAGDIAAWCSDQVLDPDLNIGRIIKHGFWCRMDSTGGFQVVTSPATTKSTTPGPFGKTESLLALEPIPCERFRYLPNTTILAVQPGDDQSVSALIPVDELAPWLVTFRFDRHIPSPARRGILRPIITPWLTKRFGFEYWARDVEIGGVFRKASFPSGDKARQAELQQALSTMGSGGAIAFPDGTDVEFIVAARGTGALPHQDLITFCDQSMSKAILGSTQTSDIQRGAGSKASASVHLEIVERFAESYAADICASLREQLLKPLVARVFGSDAAEQFTPVPVIRTKSYDDLNLLAAGVKALVESGFDDDIPKRWIHERSGIPVADEDEPVLKVAAPQPGTPGGLPSAVGLPGTADGQDAATEDAVVREAARILQFRASAAPAAGRLLDETDRRATREAAGSGEPLLAKYIALIEQTRKDGGDLGHLAARVRLHASMDNQGKTETADLIAAVMAEAMRVGFTEAAKA